VFATIGGSTFQSGFTQVDVCLPYLKTATVLQECTISMLWFIFVEEGTYGQGHL